MIFGNKLLFASAAAFAFSLTMTTAQAALYSTDAANGLYATSDDPAAIDIGNGTIVNLGWDGYPNADINGNHYDQLTIGPASGDIVADGIYLLNTFDFLVDLNRYGGAGPFHYTFTENLTIGSVTHPIVIPFTVSISSADTLIFASSDPMFDLGLFTLDIESLPTAPLVNGGGHVTGEIYARVTGVPEPAALALFAVAMLSLVGFGLRRRGASTD